MDVLLKLIGLTERLSGLTEQLFHLEAVSCQPQGGKADRANLLVHL